jgi:hypothetical protein
MSPPGKHDAVPELFLGRLPVPVTVPAVLVIAKVLEKLVKKPPRSVLKLPVCVNVPGKGPAAVPLREKWTLPSLVPLQVPLHVDPLISLLVKDSPASEEGVAA